jgi:hypothetical protein
MKATNLEAIKTVLKSLAVSEEDIDYGLTWSIGHGRNAEVNKKELAQPEDIQTICNWLHWIVGTLVKGSLDSGHSMRKYANLMTTVSDWLEINQPAEV